MPAKSIHIVISLAALALSLAACASDGANVLPTPALANSDAEASAGVEAPSPPAKTLTVQEPGDVKYYPSDEPLKLATEYFSRGNYGMAERYFRDAVEKAPRDATAWVGLAASYDRIGRFDLADRAYRQAIRLVGETGDILNNQGYSYMLRGNYTASRKKFLKALAREPDDPTIANNLQLLNSSARSVERDPDAGPR
jgi:Flp pilus assembly protein TadD